MNNEEKAINIGENNLDKCFGSKRDYGVTCALDMAQWKDEQLSKCLERLKEEYIHNGLFDVDGLAARLATLQRIEEEMK